MTGSCSQAVCRIPISQVSCTLVVHEQFGLSKLTGKQFCDFHSRDDAYSRTRGIFIRDTAYFIVIQWSTGCPKINFTFLNVNNVRTSTRIATPAIYIDRGDLQNYFGTKHDALTIFKFNYNVNYVKRKKHSSILSGKIDVFFVCFRKGGVDVWGLRDHS